MSFNQAAARRLTLLALLGLSLGAAACGSSSSSTTTTSPSTSGGLVTIFITNGVYSPNPLSVAVGQQINWKNNDSIEHSATSSSFDTGSIPAFSAHDNPVTMSVAGTFNFHCSIHPGETGSIIVK
jgi:plastocyanin